MKYRRRLIVVGAGGYIGRSIFTSGGAHFEVIGTSSAGREGMLRLNLKDPECFDYDAVRAGDIVLLTAAISEPDICAKEHDRAWAVNVTGTSDFIEMVLGRGARVVFLSSDTVYGERAAEFGEDATCNPAGEYALMKNAVERRFAGESCFKSVRLSYVFSREDKFTKFLIGCVQREEEIEIFHPFYRAVVHRDDVVDGVLALARHWDEFPQPIINFGGPEVLSRIAFAECLKAVALSKLKYRVTDPGEVFFRNRPTVIAMKSEILPKLLERPCRTLQEAATLEFIRNLRSDG